MKKIFSLMAAACAVMAFASCEKDNGGENTDNGGGNGSDTPAAITVTWEGHDDLNAPVEITSPMSVKINVAAPAGFQSFVVDINSAPLNNIPFNLTSIDFINPGAMGSIVEMILGEQDINTVTSLALDLSNLVPLIAGLSPEPNSNHIFTLKITDKDSNTFEQALTFHYTGTSTSSAE